MHAFLPLWEQTVKLGSQAKEWKQERKGGDREGREDRRREREMEGGKEKRQEGEWEDEKEIKGGT